MEKLIKSIRLLAGMSQEQFAAELGTTVASVNRWENGKAIPNRMAQKQLEAFCKDRDLTQNMADEIVKSYTVVPDDGSLILYHGSKQGINGPIRPRSRTFCDFGSGFYMGTDPAQPLTLICGENSPKLYTLKVDIRDLKVLTVGMDMDWAMLIAYHRGHMKGFEHTAHYSRYASMSIGYDMVVGYIADDRMYIVMRDFFRSLITDAALMNSLSVLDMGKQYVCINQKACDRVEILSERTVTPFELNFLRERSQIRREEGIALTESVAKKYRREGRFFDEILKEEQDGQIT